MYSTVGIDHLTTDELATWQARLTEELAADFDGRPLSTKAERYGRRMLRLIEAALARKNYDPRTKKPPRAVESVAAVQTEQTQETCQL